MTQDLHFVQWFGQWLTYSPTKLEVFMSATWNNCHSGSGPVERHIGEQSGVRRNFELIYKTTPRCKSWETRPDEVVRHVAWPA